MNTLSLFLYFADVMPNFSWYLFWIGPIALIITFIVNFLISDYNDTLLKTNKYEGKKTEPEDVVKLRGYFAIPLLAFFFMTASFLIPNKATFLAIAASEIGEEMINKPQVSGILNDTLALVQKKLKNELDHEMGIKPSNNGDK